MAKVVINSKSQLETHLKRMGFKVGPGKTQNSIVVYVDKNVNREKFLKEEIAPVIGGKYSKSPPIKSSAGGVQVSMYWVLAKPSANTHSMASLSTLDARQFVKLGRDTKFKYMEKDVSVRTFTSAATLKSSIIQGVKSSAILGPSIAEMVAEILHDGKVTWDPDLDEQTKNKLGVYLGEVLIGVVALEGSFSKFVTGENPIKGRVSSFHMPTDPAFSGVDSFIEMPNKDFFAISSKFGRGAAASVFTNLVPKSVGHLSTMKASKYKNFILTIVKHNLKPTDSKTIVYTYGVRSILKMGPDEVRDPLMVFEQIKSGKLGPEARKVITKIKTMDPPEKVERALPESVSSFFNESIAHEWSSDKPSMDQIRDILVGKGYWQVNMDQNKWLKGEAKFKFTNSGEADVGIIGSKSPATDLSAKQGWINYILT